MSALELKADCGRCFGLCCVIPAFAASADFAVDKPAGQPCRNLQPDFRCGIHERLRSEGFAGCTVYDCFGAGQQVSQVTFAGRRDWPRMAAVFPVMRQLHELLWYVTEALALPAARSLEPDLRRALDQLDRLTRQPPDELAKLDLAPHWNHANDLLLRASTLARSGVRKRPPGGRGADPSRADGRGADRRGTSRRGANLRGADLIGADLRGADLRGANLRGARLIGANLAGADLRLADLTGSLFVTQSQLAAANGDPATRLPRSRTRPTHWAGAPEPGR